MSINRRNTMTYFDGEETVEEPTEAEEEAAE